MNPHISTPEFYVLLSTDTEKNQSLIFKYGIIIDSFNSGGDTKAETKCFILLAWDCSNSPRGKLEIVFPNCFTFIISLILGKCTSRNYFCIEHLEQWPIRLQHRAFSFHDLIGLTGADVHTHAHFCLAKCLLLP